MSDSPTSDANSATASAPAKKSKLIPIIAIVLILVVGGGAAGFFFLRKGSAAENTKDEKTKKTKAKKTADDESSDSKSDGEDSATKDAKDEGTGKDDAGAKDAKKTASLQGSIPDDEDVKNVIEMQPFIVNLADSDQARYLRLTVSIGVGEAASEKPDMVFLARVRNALLAVLVQKRSDEVLTVEGKAILRKEMLKAARMVSEEPKVEAIYITDFIVQL